MRWFKHKTDSRRNPNIQAIRGRWGLPGVTRYFWILEIIAEEMNASDKCEISFRPGFWVTELGFRSAIDCRSFLEWLANDRGMIGVQFGNEWSIKCDKLLKVRAPKSPTERKKLPLDGRWKMEDGRKKKREESRAEKIQLSTNGTVGWIGITDDILSRWEKAYPACNVDLELKKAAEYILANPTRKKKNYQRYLVNWLSRSQERGGTKAPAEGNWENYKKDSREKRD